MIPVFGFIQIWRKKQQHALTLAFALALIWYFVSDPMTSGSLTIASLANPKIISGAAVARQQP